jgi:SAM-dependent methyltransferase
MATARSQFDAAYYDRFYRDPKTRVSDTEDTLRLARFVLAYLDYLQVPVSTALDLGCGVGRWGEALRTLRPDVPYTGVEISEAMCRQYGWQQGSVTSYRAEPADLVICHGVLQYLSDAEAKAAIANLARHTRGALYLEVVTREDWDHNVNKQVTDGNINLRRVKWYRRQLAEHFLSAGGGVYVPKEGPVVLYELERGAE